MKKSKEKEIKKKIIILQKEIEAAKIDYFQNDDPLLSDNEYDSLIKRYKEFKKEYPSLFSNNDKTLNVLVEQAILQAEAGCDAVAPSDMMDGRVAAIRLALDDNGHQETQIISYAAKYASSFYGPFRDAVGSKNSNTVIDKSSYQMNPANSNEAIREISLDINEGADMVIVKPGMPYLDIIYRASSELKFPTLAYQVSGEYAMIKHAAEKNFLDLDKAIIESLLSFKRAGACGILSYFSIDAAKLLKNL